MIWLGQPTQIRWELPLPTTIAATDPGKTSRRMTARLCCEDLRPGLHCLVDWETMIQVFADHQQERAIAAVNETACACFHPA